MKCANHARTDAVASCAGCGKPLCRECSVVLAERTGERTGVQALQRSDDRSGRDLVGPEEPRLGARDPTGQARATDDEARVAVREPTCCDP
jgi:hypothetical protein